jgi:hypothetical protein
MYGKVTAGGASSAALAYTGVQIGWLLTSAIVLLVVGFTLLRLARSKPSRVMRG